MNRSIWMVLAASTLCPAFANDAFFEKMQTERINSSTDYVWRQFGPGMSGNNVHIYWHPTDANVVFLGPNMGCAYRSTDKGQTYQGILDHDSGVYTTPERGPIEITSPDFSRQNADFGFCTKESSNHIFKTTDKGKTWTYLKELDAVWGDQMLNTIAVDPSNDKIWFVGSGDSACIGRYNHSQANLHGSGNNPKHIATIWKTTDGGKSWNEVTPNGIDPDARINRIIVHPSNSSVVFAATSYGFYKSTNGGETWGVIKNGFDGNIIRSLDMQYNKKKDKVTLFAIDLVQWEIVGDEVITNAGGIFKSTDEGESWEKINGNLEVDVAELSSDSYFTMSYTKALSNWFDLPENEIRKLKKPTALMPCFTKIIVDPNNANKIFILNDYKNWGGNCSFYCGMLWRTDNGGKDWFATLRNGTAWEGKHKDYWEGRKNPTSENMTLRAQYEWGMRDSYERKAGGALGFSADSSVIMFQWAKVVCISTDGGDTWVENDEVETEPGTRNYVAAGNSNLPGQGFRQDPRFPNELFAMAGENDFWVTTEGGEKVRPNALAARRMSMGEAEYSCADMAFHPKNEDTIYTLQFRQASAGKLLKSTNFGITYEEIGTAIEWPEGESTNDPVIQDCLTIDPVNPDNMYFCVPKTSLDIVRTIADTYGIRKSTDGGKTWEWSNTGLPKDPDIIGITMDPKNPNMIYACLYGANGGLYVSDNQGEEWFKIDTLPKKIKSVQDLHFSKSGTMYLSCGSTQSKTTDDGGVWVSKDQGETWEQLFKSPWARLTRTALYDEDVILVQVNGTRADTIKNPGTYLSKDGGKTWTKINNGNIQSDRVNDLAIDQVKPDTFYASTYGSGWYQCTTGKDSEKPTVKPDPEPEKPTVKPDPEPEKPTVKPDPEPEKPSNNKAPAFHKEIVWIAGAKVNTPYKQSVKYRAEDPERDALKFTIKSGPSWLSMGKDGTISGTPAKTDIGFNDWQIQVKDVHGASDTATLRLKVIK